MDAQHARVQTVRPLSWRPPNRGLGSARLCGDPPRGALVGVVNHGLRDKGCVGETKES